MKVDGKLFDGLLANAKKPCYKGGPKHDYIELPVLSKRSVRQWRCVDCGRVVTQR